MEVDVRQLRDRLSELLARAAAGDHLVVTESGQPKALLGPLPAGGNVPRDSRQSWITPPSSPGAVPPRPPRARASMSVQDMVDEDRFDD